jgi:hypothetical protein
MAEPTTDGQWFNDFLIWERTTHDTIDFKCVYVDMTGDLIAGLMLSQLVYWCLIPNGAGNTKLRVSKDGHLWIAKNRDDWWDEIRITAKQVDRATKILVECGLIEKRVSLFAGKRTVLLRVIHEAFRKRWGDASKLPKGQFRNYPKVNFEITQRSISESTEGEDRNCPKGNIEIAQRVTPITEITTEITTETTAETTDMAADAAAHVQEANEDSQDAPACQGDGEELPLHRQMFEALATACAWDIELITNKQRGALNQTEKRLRLLKGQSVTPADVLAFGEWWGDHDWRGKQGEHPRPDQVRAEWGRFRYWQNQQAEAETARQEAAAHAERIRVAKSQERQTEETGPPELVAARRLWSNALDELALQVDRPAFTQWLEKTRVIGQTNGRLRISVESERVRDWLENRLGERIRRAIKCVSEGAVTEIEFVLGGD